MSCVSPATSRPAPRFGLRLAPRDRRSLLAWGLALLAVLPQPWHELTRGPQRLIDLQVYRNAGVSLLQHTGVYAHVTWSPSQALPFTYPPLAAILAVPLALLPFGWDALLWEILIYAVLAWVVVVLTRPLLPRVDPRWRWLVRPVGFLAGANLLAISYQVRLGQVGLFLMALVVLDLLTTRTGRWQGVLVGLATMIKLTPGLFIIYLWAAGKRRAAVVAAASAAGFALAAAALSPATSQSFWFHALFDSNRLGDNAGTSNQSLRGMLLRSGLAHGLITPAFVVFALALGWVGLRRAVSASRAGDELGAVTLIGLLCALDSPVAWIHHFVFVLPAIVVLAREGYRRWSLVAVGYFIVASPWWGFRQVNANLLGLAPLWRVAQDSYGLASIALVLFLPVARAAGQRFGSLDRELADLQAADPAAWTAQHIQQHV